MQTDDLLKRGVQRLAERTPEHKHRRALYDGRHDLPFAPKGVNAEYRALQEMARVPLIRLAIRTPAQRLRVDGIRTGAEESTDRDAWDVWQANRLDARQRGVYIDALVHGTGIVSVWPDPVTPAIPHVQHEDPRSVYVEMDPSDPHHPLWAVKTWQEQRVTTLGLSEVVGVAMVYTDETVARYEHRPTPYVGVTGPLDGYERVDEFPNPLGRIPFVPFVPDGGMSAVDALEPMQQAIDTMRFNLLLAAQFAAYRQRVVVGYDPVVRDEDGNPMVQTDAEGEPILDADGLATPITASPGRAGVDRLLVFPGADTKVFDVAESNLGNYVTALDMLFATFASTAQVPPQYLVGDFKNVNGDLMAATEATLLSYIADLQTEFGESWEEVFRLVNIARGTEEFPPTAEVVWADGSPKSISVVGSAMAQMVPNGAPPRMFLEMLPGATQQKVDRWMGMSADGLERALGGDLAAALAGPKPTDEEPAEPSDGPSFA